MVSFSQADRKKCKMIIIVINYYLSNYLITRPAQVKSMCGKHWDIFALHILLIVSLSVFRLSDARVRACRAGAQSVF